jgi:hypothetical protein
MAFTAEAQAVWDRIPEADRDQLLSAFCSRCLATRRFTVDQGEVRSGELAHRALRHVRRARRATHRDRGMTRRPRPASRAESGRR